MVMFAVAVLAYIGTCLVQIVIDVFRGPRRRGL
jgi:hypothetical protein